MYQNSRPLSIHLSVMYKQIKRIFISKNKQNYPNFEPGNDLANSDLNTHVIKYDPSENLELGFNDFPTFDNFVGLRKYDNLTG